MRSSAASCQIERIDNHKVISESDFLALEEPLEIRLGYDDSNGKRRQKTISITMRTPGNDEELAAGFLFTEGILFHFNDIDELRPCGPIVKETGTQNVIRVELKPGTSVELSRLERHFYTSSSCGVCGKTSIEALQSKNAYCNPANPAETTNSSYSIQPLVRPSLITGLPETLRKSQTVFNQTGGLHASALFSETGELILSREDVGRHNALDKVIGYAWMNQMIPLSSLILLVSGRASFELIQKAAMANIQVFAAVGAPSSLAVELARQMKMTLLGFVRDKRFNIYSGERRVLLNEASNSEQLA